MDTRILPKVITKNSVPVNKEDVNNKNSSFKIEKDQMTIDMGSWRQLWQLRDVLWMPLALALFAIIVSCWLGIRSFYGYNTVPEHIMYIVDNNMELTEEMKNGKEKNWADKYKSICKEKDKETAERILVADIKHYYFIEGSPAITIIILSGLFLFGVWILLYLVNMFSSVMILNRKEGTFAIRHFFGRKSEIANFADDKEFVFRLVSSFRFGQNLTLSIRFVKSGYEFDTSMREYEEFLSFFTHYMDRNRPLPEGTAFDPYRQEDYERRKAEGFPKPLFPSSIPMTDVDGNTQRYKKG